MYPKSTKRVSTFNNTAAFTWTVPISQFARLPRALFLLLTPHSSKRVIIFELLSKKHATHLPLFCPVLAFIKNWKKWIRAFINSILLNNPHSTDLLCRYFHCSLHHSLCHLSTILHFSLHPPLTLLAIQDDFHYNLHPS